MSYCVNCGVKLEQSLQSCPLCHTPVINPNELKNDALSNLTGPFATEKGEVEPMKKYDIGLWLTLVFGSTAIACGILNLFVFKITVVAKRFIHNCLLNKFDAKVLYFILIKECCSLKFQISRLRREMFA